MEQLGINSTQLITQIISILLLIFLLSKFLYTPILNILDERKKKIEEGLALTEQLQREKENLERDRKAILTSAEEEGRKIVEKAIKLAREKAKEVEENEQKKVSREMEKVREELIREREKILDQTSKHTVHLAVKIAEQILKKELSEKDGKAFLGHAIRSLEKEEIL